MTATSQVTDARYAFGVNYEACKLMTHVQSHDKCVGAVHVSYPLDAPFHGIDAANKQERDEAKLLHNGIWEFAYQGFDEEQAALLTSRLRDVLEAARSLAVESNAVVLLQVGKGSSCRAWIRAFLDPILMEPRMSGVRLVNNEGKTLRVKSYAQLPDENFVFVHIGLYARVGENALDVKPGTLLIPHSECYLGYGMCPDYPKLWREGDVLTCTVQDADEMKFAEWENELETSISLSGKSVASSPNMTSRLQHLCHPRLVLFGNADNAPWLTTQHYSAEAYARQISVWSTASKLQAETRQNSHENRRCH